MKKGIGVLVLVLCASAALAAGSLDYLKYSNYNSYMKTAVTNLEKLFLDDQLEFSTEGRRLYIEAWKLCQNHQAYPSGGSLQYLAISTARDNLQKATETLDTLVYDQMLKFKTPAAKALYREALKSVRVAVSSL